MAKIRDLFENGGNGNAGGSKTYTAKDNEVLEGLEPVRRRPGMYIGGTDERALHHLAAEILDNAMDEAVAGHASRIEIELKPDDVLVVRDNGRGIPVDPHPKFKNKSALEVIMTTLHAGGKFGGKVYDTSGGLHGVGASVVNALSEWMDVEVARDKRSYKQRFERGHAASKLKDLGAAPNRRGTIVTFKPDVKIFGASTHFSPRTLYRMARSKAYLFRGVEIRWKCEPSALKPEWEVPAEDVLKFPGGLLDFLTTTLGSAKTVARPFSGQIQNRDGKGAVECAIAWTPEIDAFVNSYCNTIPTLEGGTHEQGLRSGLTRSLRSYGESVGNRKVALVTPEDLMAGACAVCRFSSASPSFKVKPRKKLSSPDAQRLVEWACATTSTTSVRTSPGSGRAACCDRCRGGPRSPTPGKRSTARPSPANCGFRASSPIAAATRRPARKSSRWKAIRRRFSQTGTRPRHAGCSSVARKNPQCRERCRRGKLEQNQELSDLVQALGAGTGSRYRGEDLRYERVIIMTDADVDGAHIASLLLTFFYRQMKELVTSGHLFLAMPPLYRLSQGSKIVYARDDRHKDELLRREFKSGAKVDVSASRA
jgi:topoisomerase-4 subunit B